MEKLVFQTEDGEKEFIIEAEVRMSGKSYILISEETDEEEADCWILADVSRAEDEEAVYEEVTDEELLDLLMPLFEEELEDTDLTD